MIRLLVILIAGGFIAWRVWARAEQASRVSENDAAEQLAWKQGLVTLRADDRYRKLLEFAQGQVPLTNDDPTGDAYRLTHVSVLNEVGLPIALQELDHGAYLALYAKGPKGQKQFSMSLKDQAMQASDLSMMAYQSVVPSWATVL